VAAKAIENSIDNFQTHVVPIIADIDAGFGNEEATYLLAKKMIEAGACAIQIENQVSDEKQCGHQDGKVTVPHEDFLAKIRACATPSSSSASRTASSWRAPIRSARA
jgi:isocitrate lyase